MSLVRPPVGEPETYKGHTLQARFLGPDLLGYVDDVELPNFYASAAAARDAGRRYVDDQIKERGR